VTVLSALSVFVLWRSTRLGFDAKVAALLTAIFLSAPYLWYYEAAVMPLVGLFFVRAGILGRGVPPLALLGLLWVGAGLLTVMVFFDAFGERFPWALVNTPVMLLSLGLCFWQLRPARRPAGDAA
jgi:hypothetical protein